MKPFFALLVTLVVILLVGVRCSLSSFPATVVVGVALNPPLKSRVREIRGGPELSAMKCYGLIVKGAPSPVNDVQLGNRSASCLGMDGAFFGPYRYEELVSGVSLSLPASSLNFSVVGFDGVADCGAGPSNLYSPSVAAQNYAVGEPIQANLATTSKVSINASSYSSPTATDRTPTCPVQTLGCTAADVCDTFHDADGTPILSHVQNTGGAWIRYDEDASSAIYSNQLVWIPRSVGVGAIAATPVTQEASASLLANFGNTLQAEISVVLRLTDRDNFAEGVLFRSEGTGLCTLAIYETISGVRNSIVTDPTLPYPSACDYNKTVQLDFRYSQGIYRLTYGTTEISTLTTSPGLIGALGGFRIARGGAIVTAPRVFVFRSNSN